MTHDDGRAALDGVVSRALRATQQAAADAEQRRGAAIRELDRLTGLDPARARLLIQNVPSRRPYELIDGLLEEVAAGRWSEPGSRLELLDLADELLRQLDPALPPPLGRDLEARALAYRANTHRQEADFVRAAALLQSARTLAGAGSGDAHLEAELDLLEGSLLHDLHDLSGAAAVLRRSAALLAELHDPRTVRALTLLGLVLTEDGRHREAQTVLCNAIDLADAENAESAMLAAHNLSYALAASGDYSRALRVLESAGPLYRSAARGTFVWRVRWLEARIRTGLGQHREAWALAHRVAEAMAAAGLRYDAGLALLDEAVAAANLHAWDSARRAAAEAYQVFASSRVAGAATGAIALLSQVVQGRCQEVAALQQVATELVRRRPAGA